MIKIAKDNTVAGLYLRLRLNYDDLNQDFVRVEETVKSNVQRLGRESSLINLKAAIDLNGVTDAEQRLKIEQEKLTKLVEVQTQKVKLLEVEWKAAAQAQGNASKNAQSAEIAFKQQELALAKLSQRLKEVTEQQNQMSQAKTDKANFDNSLLGRYTNIKGDVSGHLTNLMSAFSGLKDASSSADAAITKTLEIIGSIPHPVGKAVAALASIPLVVRGIENSLLDMAKPAIAAGDAMYVMSRGMQLSIADTAKLATVCKVTGIEISEVNSSMRRLSAQLNKNSDEDNARMKMLERFGAQVKDNNGNIKNEVELIGELSKALLKAEAAGQGAAFRDIVGGRFWSGDFITFLEDYAGNVELAGKIVKNGLANPVLAHEVQGNLNAMNAQIGQFQSALSSAFIPATQNIVPQLTEQFGELTKVIAENAEGIKNVSMAIGEVVSGISSLTTEIAKLAVKSTGLFKEPKSAVALRYKDDYTITNLDDLVEKEYEKLSEHEKKLLASNIDKQVQFSRRQKDIFEKIKENWIRELAELQKKPFVDIRADWIDKPLTEIQEKVKEAQKAVAKSWADFRREFDTKIDVKALSEESLKRIEKYKDELEHLKINLDFSGNDYQKSLAELDLWYRKALELAKASEEERNIVTESYGLKREQLERDRESKLAEIRDSVAALDKSSLENKLASIEKEKAAWIKAGMEEAEATELAQRKIEQAKKESLEKINSYVKDAASIEYDLTHDAFEKQLYDIEQWKQAQSEKADTAEEVSAIIANAAAKEADAFEKEMDRIKGKIESAQDELARLTLSSYENDIRDAKKHYQEQIQSGVPQELAAAIHNARMQKAQNQRAEDTSGNYSKRPLGNSGNYDTGQFIDFSNAVEHSTQSLTELDAAQLARKQIEEKIARVGEELDGNFSRANLATANYQDALKSITGGSESASDNLKEALQNAGDATADLQNNFNAAAGDIQNLGDVALRNAQGLESATDTFNRAIEMSRLIEEQNRSREQIEFPEPQKNYPEIIYGDDDVLNSMQRWRNVGAEINYGDLPEFSEFNNALNTSAADIENLINSTGQVTASMDELITSSEQLRDQAIKTANTPIVPESLPNDLMSVGNAGNQAAEKFQQVSDTLESVNEKLANLEFQPPQQPQAQSNNDTSDIAGRALDATSTLGEAIALAGTAKGDPRVALVGAGIQTFADVIQRLRENIEASNQSATDLNQQIQQSAQSLPQSQTADMTGINSALSDMSQKLADISQRASEIANSSSKPPQQNINVSPNINIDLGGAYVFDDSMKQQLTDDITSQVASAITDAVNKATSQVNYGYGN